MALAVGEVVAAPLGPRLVRGVVVALRDGAGGNRPLKPVEGRLETPPLPPESLAFIEWAARYAVDSPAQPLAIALRGSSAPQARPERAVVATGRLPSRPTVARARVMVAASNARLSRAALARDAGVSAGVVSALIADGALAE